MKNNYEINMDTMALIPISSKQTKVIEVNDSFIINNRIMNIIENSCRYFSSSYGGRVLGTKHLIGVNYKVPIIIEESNVMIFFPTSSPRFDDCCWISLKHVDRCEIFSRKETNIIFKNGQNLIINVSNSSFKNQILRSTLLESVIRSRKN